MIPGLGRSPGEGKGYALQYSGLENSMDYSSWDHKELDTTEQLSLHFVHSQLQFPSPSVSTSSVMVSPGEVFQTFIPKPLGYLPSVWNWLLVVFHCFQLKNMMVIRGTKGYSSRCPLLHLCCGGQQFC